MQINLFFCSCSYDDEIFNASRTQQQQNPEVKVPAKSSVVIIQLHKLLEAAARDIRYLLSLEICVSDDEDIECVQPDDYCNIPTIPEVEVDYSGSGEPPTLDFTSPTGVSSSNSSTNNTATTTTTTMISPTASSSSATPSSPTVVPPVTDKPSGPTLPDELTPRPKTDQPEEPDETEDGGASSIHQSLHLLLLLTTAVMFLL